MILRGTIEIDLTGTTVALRPPSAFFRGVANLMTSGRWATREEHETYKLMGLVQAAHRVLADLGVRDVIRVAVGPTVVYEDLDRRPDDFEPAMEVLSRRLEQESLDLGPQDEFDLLMAHDDGTLNKVIDLDFRRRHRPGEWPLAIRVTGVPSELRREPNETDEAFDARLRSVMTTQEEYEQFHDRLELRMREFLDAVVSGLGDRLGIENTRVDVRTEIVRGREADPDEIPIFGSPLYGYNPTWDLAYLWLWNDLMANGWRWREPGYRDPGAISDPVYTTSESSGWSGSPSAGERAAATGSASGGGADLQSAAATSDSGGGADLQPAAAAGSGSGGGADLQSAASESHGGGWLSSITDFFSGHSGGDSGSGGSSDAGGADIGGDGGSSDAGGGDSGGGCGSSCGGGCGSSGD